MMEYFKFLLVAILCNWGITAVEGKVKTFLPGYNGQNLPSGGWTKWFNVDRPGSEGDFETLDRIVREYGQGCDGVPCNDPIGIKVLSKAFKTPRQEGNYVKVHPLEGATCETRHQISEHPCADYMVRFYCPGMHEQCRQRKSTRNRKDKQLYQPSDKSNQANGFAPYKSPTPYKSPSSHKKYKKHGFWKIGGAPLSKYANRVQDDVIGVKATSDNRAENEVKVEVKDNQASYKDQWKATYKDKGDKSNHLNTIYA